MFAIIYFVLINLFRAALLHGSGDHTLFEAGYAPTPIVLWATAKLHQPRWLGVIGACLLLLVAITGDVVDVVSRRFSLDQNFLVVSLQSARDLPWGSIWLPLATVAVIVPSLTLVLAYRALRPFHIWPLCILLAVLGVLDLADGDNRYNDVTSGVNILSMSSLTALVHGLTEHAQGNLSQISEETMAKAAMDAATTRRQILSVSIESLGYMLRPEERLALIKPLLVQTQGRYQISEVTTHRFRGATLAGETRELCGLRLAGSLRGAAMLKQLHRNCLPRRLVAAGYETDALHGNGGGIYNRKAVYPAMGFQRTWFFDDLQNADTPTGDCPTALFVAACDERVFSQATKLFNGRRRFVHVMTIDTHLPILSNAGSDCPAGVVAPTIVCRYMQAMRHTFAALGRALRNAPVVPDQIVIYGDHAPPFFAEAARDRFSREVVPYLVLDRTSTVEQSAAEGGRLRIGGLRAPLQPHPN